MENLLTCTPRNARAIIEDIIQAGLVPYVESSPGIGKSSIMRAIADSYNLKMIDHRLTTSAPEDLSGLPRFNEKGEAVFAPFAELFPLVQTALPKDKDGWMVFLDEFPSASREVQAAAYKLILDRMVGQNKLHDRVVMTAAGNRRSDRAIVNPIGTAMASRLIHLEMVVNAKEWLEDVAMVQGYDHRILAYISQFPDKLLNFDPDSNEKTFACPRTWEFANKLLSGRAMKDTDVILLAGTVGQSIAMDFVQYVNVFAEIPHISNILADPNGLQVPNTPTRCWATISMMLGHVEDKTITQLVTYAMKFTADFRLLFFRGLNIRYPQHAQHPAVAKAMVEISQYLFA